MEAGHASMTLAVALAAGVLAQSLARHLRLPGIVLLLATGALLGPEALGWVEPRSLGAGHFGIVDFGVAIILFEGGLNLELSRLRRQEATIRRLITLGALVTFIGATLTTKMMLDWPWGVSFLFGSLVVVTGPTVVAPLLRDMRLKPKIKHILEAEGVLIDPVGAILAVLVLQIVLVPSPEIIAKETLSLLLRVGFGVGAGLAGGFLIGWLLRLRFLVPQGYENIFTLASVVLLFQGCDHLVSHSGILAVPIAGVVIGNLRTPVDQNLREFKDQLTVLLVALLFILLAADIDWDTIRALGWSGAAVIASLVLVVRPVTVWISSKKAELSVRERLFLAWIAPRGIIAAAIASLTAAAMEAQGISGGKELRTLVFMTIAGTVLLAGLTARPVAMLLGLRLPSRDRVAILGARGLGLALGKELREGGTTVVVLDSDPTRCQEAEDAGFSVVFGDAMQERTLNRAQFELVGTAIGLTSNDHLNILFIQQAKELFRVPKVYVALESLEKKGPPDQVKRYEADVLFDGPHELRRWDVRFQHGDAGIEHLEFRPKPEIPEAESAPEGDLKKGPSRSNEHYLILAVKRKDRMIPMSQDLVPREGDIASVAIYKPDHDEALRLLQTDGWEMPSLLDKSSTEDEKGSSDV